MTQDETRQDANWSGSPPLSHHWMAAVLRLAAMSLLNLAELFGFRRSRPAGACDARPAGPLEPGAPGDPTRKETKQAAGDSSRSILALMPSGARNARRAHPELVEGSKHEGVLTAAGGKLVET